MGKYCKDCKWHRKSDIMSSRTIPGASYGMCSHPKATETDPINGNTVLSWVSICRDQHPFPTPKQDGVCGVEGRLFEEKPRPWWKFW